MLCMLHSTAPPAGALQPVDLLSIESACHSAFGASDTASGIEALPLAAASCRPYLSNTMQLSVDHLPPPQSNLQSELDFRRRLKGCHTQVQRNSSSSSELTSLFSNPAFHEVRTTQ